MKELQRILQILAAAVLLLLGSIFLAEESSEDDIGAPPAADGYVQRVIDGDTLDVMENGEVQRVRLIGIDTPETVDPRKEVECFGKEASTHLQTLVENVRVTLERDSSQGEVDKYGRVLAYVVLEDGTNVGEVMLRDGYAYEYTYRTPYAHRDAFLRAENDAKEAGRGLWSPDTCNGQR